MVLSLSPNSFIRSNRNIRPCWRWLGLRCQSLIYESRVFRPWSLCLCVCVPLGTKPPAFFFGGLQQAVSSRFAQSACFVHPSFGVEQSPWTRLHLCLVALQAPWRFLGHLTPMKHVIWKVGKLDLSTKMVHMRVGG